MKNIVKNGMGMKIRLVPLLNESLSLHKTSVSSDEVLSSIQGLQDVDIAQLWKETEIPYVPASFQLSPQLVSDFSIADQPTRVLPAITKPTQIDGSAIQTQAGNDQSYLGIIRKLIKSSGIYAISSMASPLVSLLLLPFLTRMLSRTDYGVLAVLETLIALIANLSSLGLDAAFVRVFSYECKSRREQFDALSTLTLLLLLVMIAMAAIGISTAPQMSLVLLDSASYGNAFAIAILLTLLQNLTIPGLTWIRVENRAISYTIISMTNLFVVGGSTILLVGILHMGIMGALIATGLGNALLVICTLPNIFFRAGFHFRSTVVVSMLTLGVPYAMNYITMWVLQVSDRYLLGHLASLSATAIYSIAYSLGSGALYVIKSPFAMAWWVLIYPIARRDDAQDVFKLIFRWYSFVLLFATLGLSLFGGNVLNLLFPASYHGQSMIISVIALSTLFSSLFVIFNLGMTLKRKTWLAFISLFICALLNILLNIVLIPLYGAMGAAMSTLAAYFALALISYLFNQQIYPVPFEIGLFVVAMGGGFLLYFVDSKLAGEYGDVMTIEKHIIILVVYTVILAAINYLPRLIRNRR